MGNTPQREETSHFNVDPRTCQTNRPVGRSRFWGFPSSGSRVRVPCPAPFHDCNRYCPHVNRGCDPRPQGGRVDPGALGVPNLRRAGARRFCSRKTPTTLMLAGTLRRAVSSLHNDSQGRACYGDELKAVGLSLGCGRVAAHGGGLQCRRDVRGARSGTRHGDASKRSVLRGLV